MLCVYQALHGLIAATAEADDTPPPRISFTGARDAAR